MGLIAALVIGFISIAGLTEQQALAQQEQEQARAQALLIKKETPRPKARAKTRQALLNGAAVKNLKG